MIHDLKKLPEYFSPVQSGLKTFEIRFNDRNFHTGDTLILREWNRNYTGREISAKITYILHNFSGLKEGYIAMSIETEEGGNQ